MGGNKIMGGGLVIDVTFKLGDELKTTTAAFTPVCMNPSNASDMTVHGVNEEGTDELWAVGILQDGCSAASVVGRVRLFGLSKVFAGAAITAGDMVKPAGSSLGTADVGGTVLTTDYAAVGVSGTALHVLGRALEAAAATGDALTIFINPALAYQT